MRIVVTGASGLIGGALVPALRADGHEVVRLVRRPATAPDETSWDTARPLDPAVLSGMDAVVHLAGAGVGDRRWTAGYQQTIRDSRVAGTEVIASALAAAEPRPRVLLNASAVGWYGNTGDRVVDETEPAGRGFLADVCAAWEAATAPAENAGVRVVRMRTGHVLSRTGGLLGRLLPIFRLGLGGRMGSGRQYWPWISLRDQLAAVRFLLTTEDVHGPVNVTAPEPVTNAEFTKALGEVLHRPAVAPVPTVALRIAVGEFAEHIVTGQRTVPRVLTEHGFAFADRDIHSGLRSALRD